MSENEICMLRLTLGKNWFPESNVHYNTDNDNSRAEKEIFPSVSLFGYYDSLKIEQVFSWHEFRPVNHKYNGDNIRDEYTIRAVCPVKGTPSNVKTIMCKNPIVACTLVHFSDDFLESCSDLDKLYYKFRSVIDKIQSEDKNKQSFNNDDLHYGLYIGLGYPDAIVMFFSNSFEKISKCIDELRRAKIDESEDSVISSAYTLLGYYNLEDANLNTLSNEKISAVLDFAFNEEYDFKKQSGLLNAKFDSACLEKFMMFGSFDWRCIIKDMALKEFIIFHKTNFLFGKSNTLLNCLNCLETRLLLNDSIRDIENEENIEIRSMKDIDLQVFHVFEQFRELYVEIENEYFAHHRILGAINNIILQYFKIVSTKHCLDVKRILGKFISSFLTTTSALMLFMKSGGKEIFDCEGNSYDGFTYYNLIEKAADRFRNAIDPLLFDLWRSDSQYFEGQTSAHPTVGSAAKILFAYNVTLSQWDEAVDKIIPNRESDPETGFCYLVTSGGRDVTINIDLYDFNHDALTKYCIFENKVVLKKDVKKFKNISRPIIVAIPEASLYDVQGTLYRLAHEFFHKRGERLRNKRADYYYNTICDIFAANCEHYVVGDLLRKKARKIFKNRFYFGKWRKLYGGYSEGKYMLNQDALYGAWLRDVDGYYGELMHNKKLDPSQEMYWEDWGKFFKAKFNFDKSEFEKSDDYKNRVIALNLEFYNVAMELSEVYKRFKNDKNAHKCCAKLRQDLYEILTLDSRKTKVNNAIDLNKTHGSEIYNICNECLSDNLLNTDVAVAAGENISKFISKISPQFIENDGPFGDIGVKARCSNKDHGIKIWKEIVEYNLYGEYGEVPKLLRVTDIHDWMLDLSNVCYRTAEWFKEVYADCMAIMSLNDDDDSVNTFLQYIFVFLFESRNINTLFYNTFALIDAEKPYISFHEKVVRIGVVGEIIDKELFEKFKTNESKIVELIKDYANDVMFSLPNDKLETYAKNLYKILFRILRFYNNCQINNYGEYSNNLFMYLKECIDVSIELRAEINHLAKLTKSYKSNSERYVPYIINKWLSLYKNSEV